MADSRLKPYKRWNGFLFSSLPHLTLAQGSLKPPHPDPVYQPGTPSSLGGLLSCMTSTAELDQKTWKLLGRWVTVLLVPDPCWAEVCLQDLPTQFISPCGCQAVVQIQGMPPCKGSEMGCNIWLGAAACLLGLELAVSGVIMTLFHDYSFQICILAYSSLESLQSKMAMQQFD